MDLLGKPKSGRLECKQEEGEESVMAVHSDPFWDALLWESLFQNLAPEPETLIDLSDIRL